MSVSTQSQGNARRRAFLNGREVVEGEVIVKFRDQPGATSRADLEAQSDADESEAVGRQRLRRLHSRRLGTAVLMARLRNHPDVEYVEPNYVLYADTLPNDPQFGSLWGLLNTGQTIGGQAGTSGSDIGATTAWTTTTGSRNNVVGVVDTGVDYNHPDLAANIWSAPSQFSVTIGGQVITCAAGTHGFNAILKTCNPMDDNNHGTHVSGTIGGLGNNGVGVVGVNWIASIMGLKFLNSSGSGSTTDAINAIEFAIQAKANFGGTANVRVLSNSWGGGGFSQALLDEINSTNASNMLFVAAAGNSGLNVDTTPSYPASYNAPNIVAVAATDNRDQLASFSNYGASSVHLGAPGVNILSTTPNNTYSTFNGTSMATPHVSGAAALLLSSCFLSTAGLKTALVSSVDSVGALTNKTTTGGRLNVARAVQTCPTPTVRSVTLAADKVAPQGPGTTITWTATPAGGASPYQYKWFVFDGATWTNGGWTASNTFAWTPASANAAYQVFVWARSAWDAADTYEAYASAPFAVSGPRVASATLTADRVAPQAPGTTVTWMATGTSGATPYQYKWFIFDGATWTNGGWTASNTFAWTPTTVNANYQIFVWVKSAGNAADTYEAYASAPFAISVPRVASATLAANKVAPQAPGTTVTWTATGTGGATPYQYKWFIFDGATWTNGGWTASNTFAWTPTTVNANDQIFVWVKSAGNAADTYEAYASAPFAITVPAVATAALAANRTAPQTVNTTVTWTTTATAGTAPYQYKWFVYDGATWTNGGWTASNTFAWTPATANANYQIFVWVKSAGNAADTYEAYASAPFAISSPPGVSSVALAADRAAPQVPGTTITWTATAAGGATPYQYKWFIYDGASWTNGGWTASNTFAWTPASANAAYQVFVWVKSAWNSADTYEAYRSAAFAIAVPHVSSAAIAANRASPQIHGTTITWAATVSGGTAPYQYKWFIYDGATWTNFGWTASNTFAWTPAIANSAYQIFVWVKSAGNAADTYEAYASSPFVIQ